MTAIVCSWLLVFGLSMKVHISIQDQEQDPVPGVHDPGTVPVEPSLPVVITGPNGEIISPVNGKITLGPGTHYMRGTIDLGKLDGVVIEGAGKTSYPTKTNYDGQCTRLIQQEAGQYHFAGEITHFEIRNLTLVDGGVHIQASSTLGTGHGNFYNVNFRNSPVEFGSTTRNANAANTTFWSCDFRNGTVGVILNSSQNVDYNFENINVTRMSGPLIDVKGGGMVDIDGAYVVESPLLIRVSGDGSKTGPENAKFSVRNVDYDAKGSTPPTILHDDNWAGSKDRVLYVSGINFNRRSKGTLIRVDNAKGWTLNKTDLQNVESEVVTSAGTD